MGVILHLLHEGLLHVERKAERLPEGVLRILLISFIIVSAVVNPTIGVVLLCGAVVRYAPIALSRGAQERFLVDARPFSVNAANAAEAALQAAQRRIQDLERDLNMAQQLAKPPGSAKVDPDYHAVGLHEGAPPWLIESARKAYRLRLHPDRHPTALKGAAHERFVAAEACFDAIYSRRGMHG
jgi:hypothetical protein